MVGTQSTGGIIIALVVVAQVALPHGGNVLIDVHLLTQRHHQEDACKGKIKSLVHQKAIVVFQDGHKYVWYKYKNKPNPSGVPA